MQTTQEAGVGRSGQLGQLVLRIPGSLKQDSDEAIIINKTGKQKLITNINRNLAFLRKYPFNFSTDEQNTC